MGDQAKLDTKVEGDQVDSTNIDDLKQVAKDLYAEVQALAIDYERDIAGAKLAKDKAKALTS